MKKGKFILSAAAFIVSLISAIGFKKTQNGQRPVYGPVSVGGICYTTTCYTKAGTSSPLRCHTAITDGLWHRLVISSAGRLWTSRTLGGRCIGQANFTHIN